MELWIRSQDKENLVKVNDVYIEEVFETTIFITNKYNIGEWLIECNDTILGVYKTKERALEVLDEIQSLLKPTFKINYEYDDSQPIIDGEWLKSLKAESKIEELSCYVYEMPKE